MDPEGNRGIISYLGPPWMIKGICYSSFSQKECHLSESSGGVFTCIWFHQSNVWRRNNVCWLQRIISNFNGVFRNLYMHAKMVQCFQMLSPWSMMKGSVASLQ